MSREAALIVARRRNAQRTRGAEFLAELAREVGESVLVGEFADPEDSTKLDTLVWRDVSDDIRSGGVVRVEPVSLDSIVCAWNAFVEGAYSDGVLIFFSNHKDFTLRLPWTTLRDLDISKLVGFDGDTVGVAYDKVEHGLSVDRYEDTGGVWRYGLDVWGDARSVAHLAQCG